MNEAIFRYTIVKKAPFKDVDDMAELTKYYQGEKWEIIYGKYAGLEKRAVELMYMTLKKYVPYICEVTASPTDRTKRKIFIGTKSSNRLIDEKLSGITFAKNEIYYKVTKDEIIISGYDDSAVYYAACTLVDDFIPRGMDAPAKHIFELIPFIDDFKNEEYRLIPSTDDRGLWTWGHVIFDYKKYIENLARLKMNKVIVWNDFAPINAGEFVEYAHSFGVKVIWGYSWGWSQSVDFDISSDEQMREWGEKALNIYEKQYADTKADGIYFQMFTETANTEQNGVSIAKAAVKWTNYISGIILEKYPDLHIEFGLHAMSVASKLETIAKTDKRVSIVWEDCGNIPYSYRAETNDGTLGTLKFTESISSLRNGENCGAVMKSASWLNWGLFAPQTGPYIMGLSDEEEIREKLKMRTDAMRYQEYYWLKNGESALDIIRCFIKNAHGRAIMSQLVEDGLFERRVHLPVALFAEMCFNCDVPFSDIFARVSIRDYVNRI